ncbi:hypothetical protein [Halostagnicola sp. A-GB9-2]|uniref:hypothetical protein n=1 Tax=Halostagnicola sp. A-GB9-2 TaxID=3048066 RepID=UPI0024C04674|nr:hypothetical protein [Halostagnicola sp. A-GB9-2]MDJ1432194.1 hypothetical protein [Halostagnicola sp. A-GB9-2]
MLILGRSVRLLEEPLRVMFPRSAPDPVEPTTSRSVFAELFHSIVTTALLLVVLASVLTTIAVADGPAPAVYSAALATGFVVLVGVPIAGRVLVRAFTGTLSTGLEDRQTNQQENRCAENEGNLANRQRGRI